MKPKGHETMKEDEVIRALHKAMRALHEAMGRDCSSATADLPEYDKLQIKWGSPSARSSRDDSIVVATGANADNAKGGSADAHAGGSDSTAYADGGGPSA